jgi:hypothetical protein
MAVDKNPCNKWKQLRQNSDYRSTDTQLTSFVRQQLSQSNFLNSRNRVNAGPDRYHRAALADSREQIPLVLGSEDMWGWQRWTENIEDVVITSSDLAANLIEEFTTEQIPGTSYYPYNNVGGATVPPNLVEFDEDISL